jgi:hypothetical protein
MRTKLSDYVVFHSQIYLNPTRAEQGVNNHTLVTGEGRPVGMESKIASFLYFENG